MIHGDKSNNQLRVNGKMTSKGADRVGLILAISALIFALAVLIGAISLIKWW